MAGVEPATSSLPRMRSTTELKQNFLLLRRGRSLMSGKRDSNPRPPAWKASALSTELFPQERSFLTAKRLRQSPRTAKLSCGCGWIRTTEVERQQIYSLPHLATLEHTQCLVKSFRLRTLAGGDACVPGQPLLFQFQSFNVRIAF